MKCPFLRETVVTSCQLAKVRKLIPISHGHGDGGICHTPAHSGCAAYREYAPTMVDHTAQGCPLLVESHAQYCGAAPVAKMVPYSETVLSRCGNGSYRYCELYLDLTRAAEHAGSADEPFPAPDGLHFTRNHLWIDLSEDGPWHIGLDAFLARLMGRVDRIVYLTTQGTARPAVSVSVDGVDLQLTFPSPLPIGACNLYLRSNTARLTREPYTSGWLFEGRTTARLREELAARLLSAEEAKAHMQQDASRLRTWIESRTGAHGDGGLFQEGLLRLLDRDDCLRLFNEYCTPVPGEKR